MVLKTFKQFLHEAQLNDPDRNKKRAANHLDMLSQELGITPNDVPDILQVSDIDIPNPDDNTILHFNQAHFQVKKPIKEEDRYVTLYFKNIGSPNVNTKITVKGKDGESVAYEGDLSQFEDHPFYLTKGKFSKIFGRNWEPAIAGNQSPAGFGGGLI